MKTLILILSLLFILSALGQSLPDSLGFTNKAEVKNLMVNEDTITMALVSGKYHCYIISGYVGADIVLNRDSTFFWEYNNDVSDHQESKGKWILNGNAIILNSYLQVKAERIDTIKITFSDTGTMNTIILKGMNGNPLPFASFEEYIHGEKYETVTDIDGIVRIKNTNIDSIRVRSNVSNGIFFVPRNPFGHTFTLVLHRDPRYNPYRVFTNERWTFRNGKIYDDISKRTESYRSPYYQRVQIIAK